MGKPIVNHKFGTTKKHITVLISPNWIMTKYSNYDKGDKDDRVPDETTFQIEFKKSLR